MGSRFVCCIVSSVCAFAGAARTQITWTPMAGGPSARHAAGAAMGLEHNDVVVFGGRDATGVLGDTWRYTGVWSQLTAGTAPSPRSHAAMAVGTANVIHLFGGRDASGAALADTWLLAGSTNPYWLGGPTGPSARDSAALAERPLHANLVMFGGRNGAQVLGDTWLLQSGAVPVWTSVATAVAPPARHGHAMVGLVDRVVLFGGVDAAGNHLDDTWLFEQPSAAAPPTWVLASPSVRPSPRSGHAMRHSHHRGRTQLFGGEGPAGLLGDTWEWDGTNWLPIVTGTPPSPRAEAVFVDEPLHFAPALRNGLLVGGRDASGALAEVWEASSTAPAIVWYFPAINPAAYPAMMVFEAWLGAALTVHLTPDPQLGGANPLAHLILGFSNTTSALGPLPLSLGPAFNNGTLLVDPVAIVGFAAPVSPGAPYPMSIPLPATASLAGIHLFVQGFTYQPGAGGPWRFSRGYQCQLGWL